MILNLTRARSKVSFLMLIGFLWSSVLMVPVQAGVVHTTTLLADEDLRAEAKRIVQQEHVMDQLVAMGVSEEKALERIDSMTHSELLKLSEQGASLPAGGDFVGLLAFLFVVFVVTDAMCATDLFTFVRCVEPIK
jgi:uncharacterized membrane protein